MSQRFWHDILASAALLLFTLFILSPILFFGKVFSGEEQMGFYYVISDYVADAVNSGMPLLWNGGYFGGVSSSLDQFVGAFYPLNALLFSTFDFFTAHHISIAFGIGVGLVLTYFFGRLEGWFVSSSIVLALTYLCATTFAWLMIGTLAAHSFMVLPGILLALSYAAKRRRYLLPFLFGGAMLGIGLLAGFVQIVFYIYCIGGVYALFLDFSSFDRKVKWYKRMPVSVTYAGITILGLVIGFKQFYPSAAFIDLTIRTSTYAIQNAAAPNLTQFVSFVLPPLFSIPFFDGGSGEGMYIGALGIVFVLLGLFFYRTKESIFFCIMYVCIVLFASHAPLFGWLNDHVPPFSRMGGNLRWMVAGAFPIAYLSAVGVEGYLRRKEEISTRARKWFLIVLTIVPALLLVGSLVLQRVVAYFLATPATLQELITWYVGDRALHLAPQHYIDVLIQALQQTSDMFSLSDPRYLLAVTMWVATAAVFGGLLYVKNSRTIAPYLIVGLLLVDVASVFALKWQYFVPRAIYTETPALVSSINKEGDEPHSYRIIAFAPGDSLFNEVLSKKTLSPEEISKLHFNLLVNNTNLYFGIDRMDGLEPYRTLRHNRLMSTVLAHDSLSFIFDPTSPHLRNNPLTNLYAPEVQRAVRREEKIQDFVSKVPLLSMMNVKYIYSLYKLPSPLLELQEELSLPIEGREALPLYLYQNLEVLPRLYFADGVSFVQGTESDLLLRMISVKDFKKNAIIECENCATTVSGGEVRVDSYSNGYVGVTTKSTTGGWLVFSESFMPGWSVTIDGIEAPLYKVNYLFQGVYVPPGSHELVFVYRDVTMLQFNELLQDPLSLFHK